jgi:membrane associated rhomboid family serine protease
MFRSRGENLRSVFVLLFLNVAFFLLEHQDAQRYARLFRFDRDAVASGQIWRVLTYQFTQAGEGWMEAVALFITLLMLYVLGSALEEEWGTFHFVSMFAISTLTTAAVAAYLGTPILGAYFVYFTLLFVYASTFSYQRFYAFVAVFAAAILVYGAIAGGKANIAALGGSAAAYVYFLSQRIRVTWVTGEDPESRREIRIDTTAIHNSARFAGIKRAVASGSQSDFDRLLAQAESEIVAGVNICPPADYKPDHVDGYCIRCEGFAECSARFLRAHRPPAAPKLAATAPDAPV